MCWPSFRVKLCYWDWFCWCEWKSANEKVGQALFCWFFFLLNICFITDIALLLCNRVDKYLLESLWFKVLGFGFFITLRILFISHDSSSFTPTSFHCFLRYRYIKSKVYCWQLICKIWGLISQCKQTKTLKIKKGTQGFWTSLLRLSINMK